MARESRTKYSNNNENLDFAVKVDVVGSTTYVGLAKPGSLATQPEWRIKRVVEAGQDLEVTFADGNDYFDNIWDDRVSLDYV